MGLHYLQPTLRYFVDEFAEAFDGFTDTLHMFRKITVKWMLNNRISDFKECEHQWSMQCYIRL
jgi:hypothetical protein